MLVFQPHGESHQVNLQDGYRHLSVDRQPLLAWELSSVLVLLSAEEEWLGELLDF